MRKRGCRISVREIYPIRVVRIKFLLKRLNCWLNCWDFPVASFSFNIFQLSMKFLIPELQGMYIVVSNVMFKCLEHRIFHTRSGHEVHSLPDHGHCFVVERRQYPGRQSKCSVLFLSEHSMNLPLGSKSWTYLLTFCLLLLLNFYFNQSSWVKVFRVQNWKLRIPRDMYTSQITLLLMFQQPPISLSISNADISWF